MDYLKRANRGKRTEAGRRAPEKAERRFRRSLQAQTAFATLPALMQLVQTFMRTLPPAGRDTRISCRFGLKRRRVRLLACETLLPNCGPLPQTSQRLAIMTKYLR